MAKKVVTFGEIMLRLAPEGYYRLYRLVPTALLTAAVRQTLQYLLQTTEWMQALLQSFRLMRSDRLV